MICLLLPIVVPIILCFIDEVDFENIMMGFFLGFMLALLMGIILGTTGSVVAQSNPNLVETYQTEEIPLCALRDNMGTSGTFFLGTGSVDSKMKYFYLIKDGQGRMSIEGIYVNNAYLVEFADDSSMAPHILREYTHFKSWILRVLLIYYKDTTTFYIPEGSIQYNFNVDLT